MIKPGDRVTVHFENVPWFEGVVVSLPQATRDCWVIEALDATHHVQNFAEIVKSTI